MRDKVINIQEFLRIVDKSVKAAVREKLLIRKTSPGKGDKRKKKKNSKTLVLEETSLDQKSLRILKSFRESSEKLKKKRRSKGSVGIGR